MPYCDRCDRHFNSWHALYQHKANSPRHNPTSTGLKEHWVQIPLHYYCQRCDEHFNDIDELKDHYDDAHYWCRDCNSFFVNETGLHEHYRQSPQHHYCAACRCPFQSASNLRSHSAVHRPRDVPCRGKGCTLTFVSVSSMLLHLESGACVSGLTRRIIDAKIREWDRSNIITDPSRLLASSSPHAHSQTTYYATDAAWNGSAYECYLCHGKYKNLAALNQHLASPRHQDKVYVCPQATCRVKFTTLSALCQHIESERCGVHRFREVKLAMDGIVGQMSRLTM
ncbi:Zinc finger protein [Termitomyces sp. J132]|nr:Zinc finger protein [Termitomyces sp. J132]